MRSKLTYVLRIGAVLLLCGAVLFLCACGKNGTVTLNVSSVKGTESTAVDMDEKLFVAPSHINGMKKCTSSGRVELYFDTATFSVGAYDTDTKKLWSSLPTERLKGEAKPGVLELTVAADGKLYSLSSQQDSVSKGLATYKVTKSGVNVSYGFELTTHSGKVKITVPVSYRLTDGSLFVSVACGKIKLEGGESSFIKSMNLLNYFGSYVKGDKEDYLLVPDGSGALIYTHEVQEGFKPVELQVYGKPGSSLPCANVAAYGIKQGNSSMMAVIEQGEAIAVINADVASNCSVNKVGASFELCETEFNEKKGRLTCSSEVYSEDISVCYRFLSKANANYAAMASACREQLIRSGILSTSLSFKAETSLPSIVSVIGAANLTSESPDSSSLATLTTYEQAQDMLTLLKAKGFSNIYLRYRGMFSGGLNQTDIRAFRKLDSLGSEREFTELTDYLKAQGIELYPDISLISAASGSYKGARQATSLGEALTFSLPVRDLDGKQELSYRRQALRLSLLEDTTLDVLKKSHEMNITGFCLNDAGSLLYSDATDGSFSTRQKAKQHIVSKSVSLVTGRKLMVNGGNVFMLKNAAVADGLPSSCSIEQKQGYRSIPFLQMILHGMMYYSHSPVNLAEDTTAATLKCIEYGAVPSFEWYYKDIPFDSGTGVPGVQANRYYYANRAAESYELYEKANEALADIADARITDHRQVADNVFCTEFSTGTAIYVNYTDKDCVLRNASVEAKSFLRIN